jgi:glycosyltransferase involved in cell wall biosynthesis
MRVLHVVKTSSGAPWAAAQASELVRLGVDVHVALPSTEGFYFEDWVKAGAKIHLIPMDFPFRRPWLLASMRRSIRKLVDDVAPNLIHSHFVGSTVVVRYALGRNHPIPRIFQVPGPLHLEHAAPRTVELSSAGRNDYWIGTSKHIVRLLTNCGVAPHRLFFSYYGWYLTGPGTQRMNVLRNMLGIQKDQLVVGNISWFYPPKFHLGQRVGLKCHEDLIDALAIVIRERDDVVGVLAGGAFGDAKWYEERLRARASNVAGDRIRMPGILEPGSVRSCWPDFDCAAHVPLSENCGGVMEPLLAGVPTVAGRVGGLPELVVDGVTGRTVPIRRPGELARAVLEVLNNLERYRAMAAVGREWVRSMFDVRRTAQETLEIYRTVLEGTPRTTHLCNRDREDMVESGKQAVVRQER